MRGRELSSSLCLDRLARYAGRIPDCMWMSTRFYLGCERHILRESADLRAPVLLSLDGLCTSSSNVSDGKSFSMGSHFQSDKQCGEESWHVF